MPNTYKNKVVVEGATLIDLTSDTVTPSAVQQGVTFHLPSGEPSVGTATGGSMVIRDEADSHGGTIRHITAGTVVTGTTSITENGSYDVAQYADAVVNVPAPAPSLQSKTAIPTESQQTVTPDTGYDGLSSVTVGAISSTYVGSGITRRSSTDLMASGATVTVPAGYYASAASKSVESGSATTPATSITANPSISVGSDGLVTATVSASKSVTPTVSAGYVSSGTAGTVTVSGSETSQLPTQAAATITPSVTRTAGYVTAGTANGTAVTVSASELVSGTKSITENGTGIDVAQYASVDVAVEGELDVPVFTVTLDSTWSTVQSVTCDKTYAECYALATGVTDVHAMAALLQVTDSLESETETSGMTATVKVLSGVETIVYVATANGVPFHEVRYPETGSISYSMSPDSLASLSVTANGTYNAPSNKVYNEVIVNVPSSSPSLQAKTNITPTTSSQTITADSGYDGLSSVQINAMPSGTAGTPTATKGSVSNHAISVTPSVTNSTGYIVGSTKTGTAVTVSASELVSGSQTITENGTVDVTNLASVDVSVAGSSSTRTATISRSDGQSIPRVQVNGTGTTYSANEAQFTWEDGDTLRFYYGGSSYYGRTYVNGVEIHFSGSGGYYTYTPPKCDIDIQFVRNTSQEVSYVYITYPYLEITSAGVYDVSDYCGVVVNIST